MPSDFKTLKKNLSRDFTGLPRRKVALLGDTATQWLAQAIRGLGYEHGLDLEVFDADIDQIERQIVDPDSELYRFAPDFVVVYAASEHLAERFATLPLERRVSFAADQLAWLEGLWDQLAQRSTARVIQLDFARIPDAVYGHHAHKTPASWSYQQRRLAALLDEAATRHGHVFVGGLDALQSELGRPQFHDPRLYYTSGLALSLDALPEVARIVVDLVRAIDGHVRKALVLDLDGTLWGGVVGEDGVEGLTLGTQGVGRAYVELQRWAKQLEERGILLVACSKNDEAIAKEPFERHPEMVLRLEDFALFVANWETKVDNLRRIQETLGIGLDALVFLDDNPFEREMVRQLLPEIVVPELPEDPGEVLPFLRRANLFETASVSAEDARRTRHYQAARAAEAAREGAGSLEDYMRGLAMTAEVLPFAPVSVPRIAQLAQRSNQFNLRTVRYTEADVRRLADSPGHLARAFTLADVHADHGLVGVVVLERRADTYFIETWLMSCRVLKRGLEDFMLNAVVALAQAAGARALVGEYLPTAKNGLVAELLPGFGFTPAGDGTWRLELAGYVPRPCFIAPPATASSDPTPAGG